MFNHFLTFVSHHWLLCSAFVVALMALLVEEAKGQGSERFVSSQAATQLINRDNALVVDVRPSPAFVKGHIAGSLNIAGEQFSPEHRDLAKSQQLPVIVVCERGQQAQVRANELEKAGFEKVHVLRGGLAAWRQDKMPLVKGK